MKRRTRNVDLQDCKMSTDCVVTCSDGSTIADMDEMPGDLQRQYRECRSKRMQVKSSDEKDFEPNIKYQTNPNTMTLRIKSSCVDNPVVVKLIELYDKDVNRVRQEITSILQVQNVSFKKSFGSGEFGLVFGVCIDNDVSNIAAVKISSGNMLEESKMVDKFHQAGIGPTLFGLSKSGNLLVMSTIDDTVEHWLELPRSQNQLDVLILEIVQVLTDMADNNLVHNDMHWRNIGYVIDMESNHMHILLLDFGISSTGANTQLDLATLISDCVPHPEDQHLNIANMHYLSEKLIKLYETNYPHNPKGNETFLYWEHIIAALQFSETPNISDKYLKELYEDVIEEYDILDDIELDEISNCAHGLFIKNNPEEPCVLASKDAVFWLINALFNEGVFVNDLLIKPDYLSIEDIKSDYGPEVGV